MKMAEAIDELVQVLIPKRHIARVYGLVAELEGGVQEPQGELVLQQVDATNGSWTDELIERMYAESPPAMKRILKKLAEQPGQEIVSTDLANVLGPGKGWPNLAGTLGAYGRRVKSRYKKGSWPFTARWDHDLQKMTYVMPAETAEIIKDL
jgi:hypothetical protein